jgi:cobalt-zinc-cadmium efflux system outer membrane protein
MVFLFRAGGASCAAILAAVAVGAIAHAAEPSPRRLTAPQAIREALAGSPVLRARRAEVEQAEGRLLTAKTYPYNPELTLEATRRTHVDSTMDHGVRLGQEIEIGGQGGQRAAAATADLDTARARLLHEERLLAARVETAFVGALRARELLEVEQANVELVRSIAEVARKRLDAGAVAQMEVNLAQVQVGRAERDLRLAEGAYDIARALLAEVVGLDPAQPPEVDGEIDAPAQPLPSPIALLESAREQRADLQSLRMATEAAHARIERARRDAIPNIEIDAFYGREEQTDRLLGGELRVRIPVFNRNQGTIAESRAALRQTVAETEATEIQIRQEVAASLARSRAARAATDDLEQQVIGTLEDNLRLLQRSFESGKTGWTEVLVFRREFVDVQRIYIETLADARLADIELKLASGATPIVLQEELQP